MYLIRLFQIRLICCSNWKNTALIMAASSASLMLNRTKAKTSCMNLVTYLSLLLLKRSSRKIMLAVFRYVFYLHFHYYPFHIHLSITRCYAWLFGQGGQYFSNFCCLTFSFIVMLTDIAFPMIISSSRTHPR